MSDMRLIVAGAGGRMGRTLVQAIAAIPGGVLAGAVETAGAVRARSNARFATSDWMAMERERGISITSTVLEFDFEDCRFNLLDTPGHQDFSEDTYRTLMAADSAIMVLDAARGIEPQTRKLYEVCRARRVPIRRP